MNDKTPWGDPLGVLSFPHCPRRLTPARTFTPILRFEAHSPGPGAIMGVEGDLAEMSFPNSPVLKDFGLGIIGLARTGIYRKKSAIYNHQSAIFSPASTAVSWSLSAQTEPYPRPIFTWWGIAGPEAARKYRAGSGSETQVAGRHLAPYMQQIRGIPKVCP